VLARKVLHIQSMSGWAPLCIGPYSQANVLFDAVVFLAGQISLDPNTMNIISKQSGESFSGKYCFYIHDSAFGKSTYYTFD